ncbi:GDP-L-fucose synthase [termite gut metagenome]|uniref:GDP-L-fucose synthase n=1 Tax=termite gut metagenome TaxID=433724 RepID=A0A5J4RYQ4_9ZZZZ
MKIGLLGTNGLLSSNIGLYCSNSGYELNMFGKNIPLNHSYSSFTPMNLLDNSLLYDFLIKNDIIIYAAGAGIQSDFKENTDLIYSLNVFVPLKICIRLKELNYQGIFVTFGSYFEIGTNTDDRTFTEDEVLNSHLNVFSDYTISKRMLSRFISSFHSSFRNWHFILPTIYGENESEHRLIPYTLKSIRNHTDLHFTSGEQVRQYIYVDEISTIIFKAVEKELENGIYNISGTESYSVREIVSLLFNLMRTELPSHIFGTVQRADTGMKILKLNAEKLYHKLNFYPSITVSDTYLKYLYKTVK